MVITNNDNHFCYMVVSAEGTEAVRKNCLERACAHCVVRKIKCELLNDDSNKEINVKAGMEIGLVGEYEIK